MNNLNHRTAQTQAVLHYLYSRRGGTPHEIEKPSLVIDLSPMGVITKFVWEPLGAMNLTCRGGRAWLAGWLYPV